MRGENVRGRGKGKGENKREREREIGNRGTLPT